MPELIYLQIFIEDGTVYAWSSTAGLMDMPRGPWRYIFDTLRPNDPPAKLMIHFIGDADEVSDSERLALMETSRRVGFTVIRFETGAPLEPEEAFNLLLLPFT